MTEHPFKKKLRKLGKKHLFVIVSALVVVIGLLCFVLAYGLTDGWAAVGAWFGGKYAVLLYIFLGCYLALIGWLEWASWIERNR